MNERETIRKTTPDDAAALRRFRCSTGSWYEDDVERFVHGEFADRVRRGFGAWIAESNGEVLAVASHEAHPHPADPATYITYLNVMAGRVDARDSATAGAARMARLLRPLFAEVFATDRSPYCYMRVAKDNVKVCQFCERCGFVGTPVPSDDRYLFYVTMLRGPAVQP